MRLHLLAVGRLRGGPESALVTDYLSRFDRTGRPLGLGPCHVTEVDERKATDPVTQGAALLRAVPERAHLVALDERGQKISSPEFATMMAGLRDRGVSDLALAIGGADGHDAALRDRADSLLSFGAMVWPHMLARVMLAEQLYRAATILAGGPYHRL
jgi:23S rRNA (pseudouridine1915-N3)-methyltransferase